MTTFLALLVSAQATSGPWVVGTGQLNTYVGADAQRLERLVFQGPGVDGRETTDIGEGLSAFGVQGIASVGVTSRFDLELTVPWYTVRANRPDAQLCADLGLDACATTRSLGVISLRGKGLVLDELVGSPFSLAVIGEARVGIFTYEDRERITNVGEGSQDLGAAVSIGRGGGLGKGYWGGFLDIGGRYRFPNTDSYPLLEGDLRSPTEEWYARSEVVLSPDVRFGFGPSLDVLWRPNGLDFTELDLTDPDRLGALRVLNLRAGATFVVRSPANGLNVSATVQRTIYAMNNPLITGISAGVSYTGRLFRRPSGG